MLVLLRIAIGCIFLVSGFEKVISPYQNFKYILEAYSLLPGWAEVAVAQVFPWLELFTGLFLVLGLWHRLALKSALVMFGTFVVVVGQALLRGLPLDQCGCFGALIHIPPRMVIVMDSFLLLLTYFLFRYPDNAKKLSLDGYLEKKET